MSQTVALERSCDLSRGRGAQPGRKGLQRRGRTRGVTSDCVRLSPDVRGDPPRGISTDGVTDSEQLSH